MRPARTHYCAPHLAIRADANALMGIGHVIRNMGIAETWRDRGGHVTFLTSEISPALHAKLTEAGFAVERVAAGYESTLEFCRSVELHAVILDGYHFDADFQRALYDEFRSSDILLALWDDAEEAQALPANIIINGNHYSSAEQYQGLTDARVLAGKDHIPLRREILEARNAIDVQNPPRNVLITLGGGDHSAAIPGILQALGSIPSAIETVRVLSGFFGLENAQEVSATSPFPFAIQAIGSCAPMAEHYGWADVVVCSGGATLVELAYLGLPALVFTVSPAQSAHVRYFAQKDVIWPMGWLQDSAGEALAKKLRHCLGDPAALLRKARAARQLVDKEGAKRIVMAIESDCYERARR